MSDDHMNALPPGYQFEGYRIERVLGAGGFGITYLATEIAIDRPVAIKEFLPVAIAGRRHGDHAVVPVSADDAADFKWGLDRFRQEAATLVAFRHPNIVPVLRFFEANGTSYLVMEYELGESLEAVLRREETLPEARLKAVTMPLLDGLEEVHAKGFLHRDIKPDNIYIRQDGSPVLIDFGAARQALSGKGAGLTAIVTEGFAPVEQYERDSEQGPFTDIYAMAASMYRCMTGERPPEAPKRTTALAKGQPDPLVPIGEMVPAATYTPAFVAAVEYGLRVFERDRPQTIAAWRDAFAGGPIPAPGRQAAHFPSPSGGVADRTIIAGRLPGEDARPVARARTGRRYALAAGLAALLIAGAVGAYLVAGGGLQPNGDTTTTTGATTVAKTQAVLEKAVTDARAAYAKAATPEDKAAAYEKVIETETELARFVFPRHEKEGKAATRQATEFYEKGDAAAAIKAATEGAKYGDPDAMNLLGVAYEEGKGIDQDYGLSTYWFRRAAELGDEFAQANLAIHYYRGLGVDKDFNLAYRWAARAAVRHHVDAEYLLGVLYERGQGVAKDYAKALSWYEAAAKQGDRAAMYAVGRLYENGLGVERNLPKAVAYYQEAADKGHPEAKKALAALRDQMSKVDKKPQ